MANAPEGKNGSEAPALQGKKRVVSGMRPTGKLHIGHYFGALENWVRLQNESLPAANDAGTGSPLVTRHSPLPAYDCFYFIADWHALTSDYADTSGVAQNTIEIMTDYLAAGLDPAKSVIFQQSLVPEHAELHLLLSMVTPLSWLERVPTYKEALEQVKDKDLHNYGFLGYPCLQTADIVIYSQEGAQLFVPVGEDQVSHVELSREIVRRFERFYGFSCRWMTLSELSGKKLGQTQPDWAISSSVVLAAMIIWRRSTALISGNSRDVDVAPRVASKRTAIRVWTISWTHILRRRIPLRSTGH